MITYFSLIFASSFGLGWDCGRRHPGEGVGILLQVKFADWFRLSEEERFRRLPVFFPKLLYPEESGSLNLPFFCSPYSSALGQGQKPDIQGP